MFMLLLNRCLWRNWLHTCRATQLRWGWDQLQYLFQCSGDSASWMLQLLILLESLALNPCVSYLTWWTTGKRMTCPPIPFHPTLPRPTLSLHTNTGWLIRSGQLFIDYKWGQGSRVRGVGFSSEQAARLLCWSTKAAHNKYSDAAPALAGFHTTVIIEAYGYYPF